MKRIILFFLSMLWLTAYSQNPDTTKAEAWKKIYRASATKVNDLIHTKLDVKFDYEKARMYGKAWITLRPHFYPTDTLNLDAKAMDINEVSLVKAGKLVPLKFDYDSLNIRIMLDRVYKANQNYTVYINYVSKPNEHQWPRGDAKGLYFINPKGDIKDVPTQIWTFGEPEYNSSWYPTIDRPNQKTTDEIVMTVPSKYVTLSNGKLVRQKANRDGTRTDTWKMDLPFAPYLLFLAVGEYAIVKDTYKDKEVSYYLEKEYAPVARKIFGLTPEMIAFYSKITGVDYPWPKYAQITGRDFVAGAQENVTATMNAEYAQQDKRELYDENRWEIIIAHELFHQWFGDLVTCESWSNITLNESIADYGETLWSEYKYGKDEGDGRNNASMRAYLANPNDTSKKLVRFHYNDPGDVFDLVSYQKGGRILHMLRNFVGDSAFFKSLNLYLTVNKFKSAEAQNLRLAFEEVTGKDLNWFFNEWFYCNGHPKLDISYGYDAVGQTAKVFIRQTQTGTPFKLPFAIDVYAGGAKKRYNVWMNDAVDTFSFAANAKPDLINVDGDKILLCEKKDNRPLETFIFQYSKAGLYVDRREAVMSAAKHQNDTTAINFLCKALSDPSWRIRYTVLDMLNIRNDTVKQSLETYLVNMSKSDPKPVVKAKAIELLGRYKELGLKPLFTRALDDSSYTVAGNALTALGKIDDAAAQAEAKKLLVQPAKGKLWSALLEYTDESKTDSLAAKFDNLPVNGKFTMVNPFASFLVRVQNTNNLKKGVDMIVKYRDELSGQFGGVNNDYLNNLLKMIRDKKDAAGLKEQSDYIKSKLPSGPKQEK
jgi:aminopeptidase N